MHKKQKAMLALGSRGEGGEAPFKKNDVILRRASADRPAAEGSRDAQIVLCASRCWRSGLHCTKKIKVYEYGKSLCSLKITQ